MKIHYGLNARYSDDPENWIPTGITWTSDNPPTEKEVIEAATEEW